MLINEFQQYRLNATFQELLLHNPLINQHN